MNEMKEKILSVIEKNSKISIKDLAIVLGEPEEEVAKAIYEMESDKTICGYHTIINWDKTNREKVVALIEVRVTPQRGHGFDHIAERIYNFPEVDTVYLMSGAYDFCVMLEDIEAGICICFREAFHTGICDKYCNPFCIEEIQRPWYYHGFRGK